MEKGSISGQNLIVYVVAVFFEQSRIGFGIVTLAEIQCLEVFIEDRGG